jgi:4-hydroxy-2-oxoheptanedioate aldolase
VKKNLVKQKLQTGEVVFGVFIPVPAPRLVELCGLAGFDYVVIDAEHGPIDVRDCEDMVRAAETAGLTAIVRVPGHEPKAILRYLDTGAGGVMVPSVNSYEEAQEVVAGVKYGPVGRRGLGPGRAALYGQGGPMSDYARQANEETMIIAQMEHVQVIEDLPKLLKMPEIDVFELGTNDLSQSMGFPGEPSRVEVQDVVSTIVRAVVHAGRVIGDTANDPKAARDLISQGYRMIDCSFISIAMGGLRRFLAGTRNGESS